MSDTTVVLTLKRKHAKAKIEGKRVTFSPHQCFAFDDGVDDIECVRTLAAYLQDLPGLTFIGSKRFVDYFLRHAPAIRDRLVGAFTYQDSTGRDDGHGLASVVMDEGLLPEAARTVFLCETLTLPRMQIRQRLPKSLKIVEPTVLSEIAPAVIPARGWTPLQRNIYPIAVPEIEFRSGLDFAIVDSPSRNLSLMPNGLGYLNNALKKTGVSFQILDLDIIAYHRFHLHRLFDMGGAVILPGDLQLPEDPWQAEHYDLWTTAGGGASGVTGRNEVLEFFRPLIDETIEALARAQPKVLGLSIQGCNEAAAREIAVGVKARLPDVIIVVGGFSCYNADIGRRAFPECDYMCVGEADLTAGPLLESLARGERPFNQPGVLSRFDTPDYKYLPAPMVHDLDKIEFPKYEWCSLDAYRNFNDYQLTPIIASRGCRWSRCTFCAERFYWRIRTPANFVDELEWLIGQGCHLFMFNESDLGGMPERVMEICDEVIRRGLHRKVKLTGQLRVNKRQTRAFFEKLREANFVALRFGIDAFSENTLRLQKKGYTIDMISQNLKDCWEVGIFTEVNWVIGVPGETDQDVEEGIELILKNRKYIGRLANINPLILVNGSVYWIDPEAHNIVFKEPKETMYARYPRALPADQWYSTHPYIDAQVRKERFERIVIALHDAGFNVGAWANRIIEDVKLSRDKARTGGPAGANSSFGEFEIAGGKERAQSPDPSEAEQAVALSTHHSPFEEKSAHEKVIPIQAGGSRTSQGSKARATPPLFGIGGQPPRLVRKTDTHKVIFHNGWYYGIPDVLADVDLTDPKTASMSGIIRSTTEEGVVESIRESGRWANLRGQYDDQSRQRAAGSYMRVDSAGVAVEVGAPPAQPKILRFGDAFLAVDEQTLATAFARSAEAERAGGKGGTTPTPDTAAPIHGGTFARRLMARLPRSFVSRVRMLIRQQAYSHSLTTAPLVTRRDNELAWMLVKALGDVYVRRPLAGLRHRLSGSNGSAPASREVPIDGQDCFIVSVVTKGAQPELMWTIGSFNLVKFDGLFYGVPHGASVDWESGEVATVPGMLVGASVAQVVRMIDQRYGTSTGEKAAASPAANVLASRASKEPMWLGTMESEGYNIVSYEGWVYGMPQELGHVDLAQVDVMEMPGVIRDVSRDAVESEVVTRSKQNRQAA